MNWLRIDDGFPDHPKVAALSDAAFRLWVTAGCWSRRQATQGFVPRTQLRALTRHRTPNLLVAELTDSKVSSRYEAPLWEEVEGGWQFHDWDDFNPGTEKPAESPRSKSDAGRLGGQRSAETRRSKYGSASPKQPRSSPEAESPCFTEAEPEATPKHAEAPDPDPRSPKASETTTKDLSGGTREQASSSSQQAVNPRSDERIPCPLDLRLTDNQRATLETSLVPAWAIDVLTTRFVSKAVADPRDTRSLVGWRKSLAAAVSGDWFNEAKRPKRDDPADEPQEPKRYWTDTDPGPKGPVVPPPPDLMAKIRRVGRP